MIIQSKDDCWSELKTKMYSLQFTVLKLVD